MQCKAIIKIKGVLNSDGFSKGLITLLEQVEIHGSIKQATVVMGMAYSKAWKMLNDAEAEFGFQLLIRERGYCATLTQQAKTLISIYNETLAAAQRAAEEVFSARVGELEAACRNAEDEIG